MFFFLAERCRQPLGEGYSFIALRFGTCKTQTTHNTTIHKA
ncbi:hypothetical protein HMPREF1860_01149 [Prevotella amnii]|uniref:Uncharacterized protein n=1 Tax=Prevotella amnii TaxID=419005 RepID=A0A134BDT0_9BACT|nr:hypothetical protein HMPREF1860_01149 [Prevotella amnii]